MCNFVEQIKKCFTEKKKDLNFEDSDPSTHFLKKIFPIRDETFMFSQREEGEVLKFAMITDYMFLNNKSIASICGRGLGGWVVCGHDNCTISILKFTLIKR